jgi:hypothetical protein
VHVAAALEEVVLAPFACVEPLGGWSWGWSWGLLGFRQGNPGVEGGVRIDEGRLGEFVVSWG